MPREHHDLVRSVWRSTGGLEALVYLDSVGPSSARRISRALEPSPATITRTLRALEAWGLVASITLSEFPFSHRYSLTPLGKTLIEAPLRAWPGLIRKGQCREAPARLKRVAGPTMTERNVVPMGPTISVSSPD